MSISKKKILRSPLIMKQARGEENSEIIFKFLTEIDL